MKVLLLKLQPLSQKKVSIFRNLLTKKKKKNTMINYLNVVCFHRVCFLVSAVKSDQSRKSTLCSRLSEKLQASLSNGEQDDDFKIDRKRIRTASTEQKVPLQIASIPVTLLIGLLSLVITLNFFFLSTEQQAKMSRARSDLH